MADNAHGFDVKEKIIAKIGFHKKKNGSDVELAQISEWSDPKTLFVFVINL